MRRDDAAAHRELLDPRLRHRLAAGRRDDPHRARSSHSRAMPSPNSRCTLSQAQRPQVLARLVVQAAQALDAVDPVRDTGSARRPGSRSRCRSRARGPACRALRAGAAEQQLDHARHDDGLGDRLAQADRQAGVFVGLVDQRAVDEAVALDCAQRGEHARVGACRRPRRRSHHARAHAGESRPMARGRLLARGARRRRRGAAPRRSRRARAGEREIRAGGLVMRLSRRRAASRQAGQCVVVGQVHLQRRDGHAPCAVAWKSVPSRRLGARRPGRSSTWSRRAGLVCEITFSAAWRRPSRLTRRG